MNSIAKIAVAGTAILIATAGAAAAFGPGGGWGPCAGGPGVFEGRGPGFGGGRGGGPGFGWGDAGIDRQLGAAEVRDIIEGRLAMRGNKRLKVGDVAEKDADTVTAEIVTVDGSLVQVVEVDRHTGRPRRAQ